MKLLAGTRSGGKQRELLRLLRPTAIDVVFPEDVGVAESSAEDALELGETFEANARRKAEYFARCTGMPTLADDSGLEVFALGGAPGVRSRRWAAASGSGAEVDAANNAELLRRLAGAPESRRAARYRCVLVWLPALDAAAGVFEGTCGGRILAEPRGSGGFGYDPLFLSDDLGRTFGEAAGQEKDAVSHRGRAVRSLLELLLGKS